MLFNAIWCFVILCHIVRFVIQIGQSIAQVDKERRTTELLAAHLARPYLQPPRPHSPHEQSQRQPRPIPGQLPVVPDPRIQFLPQQPEPSRVHCPICNDAVSSREARCPRCEVLHHVDCLAYNGGCGIYGCRYRCVA
jgi:hypothetical protein